jgi:hypothetical protein
LAGGAGTNAGGGGTTIGTLSRFAGATSTRSSKVAINLCS